MSSQRRPTGQIGRLQEQVAGATDDVRAALAKRVAQIDPNLLVELSVGIRSRPGSADASWTDSWHDVFSDNGKFDDMWINLSGLRGPEEEQENEAAAELERPGGPAT
jgi:hypothetical protein